MVIIIQLNSFFTRSPFFNLIVPTLSLVGDPLTGNWCGSEKGVVHRITCNFSYSLFTYCFIYWFLFFIYICTKRRPGSS